MSLSLNFLEAAYCNGTHHKLAFHSLKHFEGPDAVKWRNLFLSEHEMFLTGSKAPDKSFKDFKNHVLHVQSGNWGGAFVEAETWFDRTVELINECHWPMAAYAAGVLSHYVTDPVMPFHTAQSQAETNIHRAVEWSISKSYDSLRPQIDEAASRIEITSDFGEGWLEELIIQAARHSNESYDVLIDRYDFKRGTKDPPAGLDDVCRQQIAELLAYAQVLHGFILERAITEADVAPPKVNLALENLIALLQIPIAWVTRKMSDAREKKIVEKMYREFKKTGQVDKTLTEDVRVIRDLVQARTATTSHTEAVQAKTDEIEVVAVRKRRKPTDGLRLDSTLDAAPSIGKKTAARLAEAGLFTIQDLLDADPGMVAAAAASSRYITAETIRDWQDQARLAHEVPQLRGHDVQILVGGGIRTLSDLATAEPSEILAGVLPFVQSEAGKRVVKPGDEPDLGEVTRWVEWAENAA